MNRRDVLRGSALIAAAGVSGCLGSLTGGGTEEFRPAVQALNRGVDAVNRGQQTRDSADEAYKSKRYGEASRLFATARDRFDAAAAEFDTAREATSGKCVVVHDRAVKQYRRALASVEACDAWAEAATARAAGEGGDTVTVSENRAKTWDGRVDTYDDPSKLDVNNFQC